LVLTWIVAFLIKRRTPFQFHEIAVRKKTAGVSTGCLHL
jgi:hypothetical protein